jgi:hypothetical protein
VEGYGGGALKRETNGASANETQVLAFYACEGGSAQSGMVSLKSERDGEMQKVCNMGESCVSSRCLMSEEEEGRIQNDDLHTKKLEPPTTKVFCANAGKRTCITWNVFTRSNESSQKLKADKFSINVRSGIVYTRLKLLL